MPDGTTTVTRAGRCIAVGRMLQAQPTAEVLQAFAGVLPEFQGVVGRSAQAGVAPSAAAADIDADAIAQDYVRLFVGLGTPLAPPWESTWASDARLLFQRQTLDVRYWYRSAGLQVAALHREPDDHIGLELEFIGRLLERGDAETAAAFAQEHPRAWAGRWADAVRQHARHPFYPALADAATELLDGLERPE